jgi:hypothetical protein
MTSKRYYGNYYNKWRYWGAMYVLKSDSSFDYTFRNNAGEVTTTRETPTGTITTTNSSYIFSDSSYGKYSMQGDTIYFTYLTDIVKGNFNGNNIRPEKLLWQGKKLFYITSDGQVIRQKEYYMKLRKDKVGNLYRLDENWTTPE